MVKKLSTNFILDVQNIINRAKRALGADTDTELSNLLGIKQTTISGWKRRGNIDLPLIISKCTNVSLDWLIYGKEERFASNRPEEMITKIMEGMTEEQKRDVLRYAQEKELLSQLLEERKAA